MSVVVEQRRPRGRSRPARPRARAGAPRRAPRASPGAGETSEAGDLAVVAWRWSRFGVKLPELPPLERLLPDTPREERFALTLGRWGCPLPGRGGSPHRPAHRRRTVVARNRTGHKQLARLAQAELNSRMLAHPCNESHGPRRVNEKAPR